MKSTFTAGSNLVLGIELLNFLSWEKNAFFDLTVYCKNCSASVYTMNKENKLYYFIGKLGLKRLQSNLEIPNLLELFSFPSEENADLMFSSDYVYVFYLLPNSHNEIDFSCCYYLILTLTSSP